MLNSSNEDAHHNVTGGIFSILSPQPENPPKDDALTPKEKETKIW